MKVIDFWVTSGLSALLGILVGVIVKGLVDARQERRRREHERELRLQDTAVETAVEFLAAAERTTRATQRLRLAEQSGDDERLTHSREQLALVSEQAESLLPAIYLLMPSAGEIAHSYLDLCREAKNGDDDTFRNERRRLRMATEDALRPGVGARPRGPAD